MNESLMKQIQPLIDAKKEEKVIKDQILGQVAVMATADQKILKGHNTALLAMVVALVDIQDTAKAIDIKISNAEMGRAYGKSPAWVSGAFKVARDAEKSKQYIDGAITITGNATAGNTKEGKIQEAHMILIEEKKAVTARLLATYSGESFSDCQKYLEGFIGSLEEEGAKLLRKFTAFFDFMPKKANGEKDAGKYNDDAKVVHLADAMAEKIREKTPHSEHIRRVCEKVLKSLKAVERPAEPAPVE